MNHIVKRSLAVVTILATLVAYQNCSPNNVSFSDDASSKVAGDDVTNPPSILPEEEFVPAEVKPFSCQEIIEKDLRQHDGSALVIPPRSDTGICYVYRLMDAIPRTTSRTSSLMRDPDLISGDHDAGRGDAAPYVMGRSNFILKLEGDRRILLSGNAAGVQQISIDNYLLIGVQAVGQADNYPQQYIAYGSKDSTLSTADLRISFRGHLVELIPFATGGISSIQPLALENRMSRGHYYKFDIRSLDAGSVAMMSELYMIIQ